MADNVTRIADTLRKARPALEGRLCANCAHAVAAKDGALTCAAPNGPRCSERVKPGETCEAFTPLTGDPAAAPASEPTATAEIIPMPAPKPKKKRKPPADSGGGETIRRFVFDLPPDCPVRVLGKQGRAYYYLDASCQITSLSDKDHARLPLTSLFGGNVDYLTAWLPAVNQHGKVTGPMFESVGASLMTEASRRGLWEPRDMVRGRGMWLGPRGLVLHTGAHVDLTWQENGRWKVLTEAPGVIGDHVYPARPKIQRPADDARYPGADLFDLLKCWNWVRPVLDPLLLLGWIGTAYLSGAVQVRPMVFITGSRGTGKSTLIEAIKAILADWLQWSTDASAAYVTALLQHDALPIALDEQEAEEEGNRAKQMIELARLAYSGGQKGRGSSDQTAHSFTLRSPMLFSAVLPPAMEATDKSRFGILRLQSLPADADEPRLDTMPLGDLGRAALARLMRDQGLFEARYKQVAGALHAAGHGGRGQKTFGTLLTAAWALLGDEAVARLGLPLGPRCDDLRGLMDVRRLAETQSASDVWREALTQLITAPCDAYRGGAQTTVEQVLEAMSEQDADGNPVLSFTEAAKMLRKTGLSLVRPPARGAPIRLFIPNNHAQVRALFKGTKFYGTSADGGWRNALLLAPVGRWAYEKARVGDEAPRGIAVDVSLVLGTDAPEPAELDSEQWA